MLGPLKTKRLNESEVALLGTGLYALYDSVKDSGDFTEEQKQTIRDLMYEIDNSHRISITRANTTR